MFANLSEYNENLRAQDAARAARRQQPQGLASYQAKKAAQEAARLAPYSVEKSSYYSSAPWAVSWDGKAIGEFFPTKKAAVAWIEEQKQKEQQKEERPETISSDETPAQDAETPAERPETISTEKKEEQKTMKKVEFTTAAIIVNGQEYAARYEYGETPRGHLLPNIRIFTALSGNACIVEMDDDDAEYMNARAIMEKADETETPENHSETDEMPAQDAETPAEDPAQDAEQAAPAAEEEQQPDETPAADPVETPAEQPETPAEDPAQEAEQAAPAAETDETETPENHSETDETPAQDAETPAEDPARDGKQARGPVPEKTFIGTAIQGKGYSIIFDGGLNRTRVIVTDETREKLRPAIEKAGFYYSAALDSWNKKLTFRAFRAAQALAAELDKILAA